MYDDIYDNYLHRDRRTLILIIPAVFRLVLSKPPKLYTSK